MNNPRNYNNAERTSTLIAALSVLQTEDFTKRMGSGIIVSLTDLEGKSLCDRFCLPAEDMQTIKVEIIKSLKTSLTRRKAQRQIELREIETALETF